MTRQERPAPDAQHGARVAPALTATVVAVGTVLVVVWCAARALILQVDFEPSAAASWRSAVGRQLLGKVVLAVVVLMVGLPASRALDARRRWIGAVAVLLVASSVCIWGHLSTEARLHPSFAGERQAIDRFVPPPDAEEESTRQEVSSTMTTVRSWRGSRDAATTCPSLARALRAWASGRRVQWVERLPERCTLRTRVGPDVVTLVGSFGTPGAPTQIILTLVRANV